MIERLRHGVRVSFRVRSFEFFSVLSWCSAEDRRRSAAHLAELQRKRAEAKRWRHVYVTHDTLDARANGMDARD